MSLRAMFFTCLLCVPVLGYAQTPHPILRSLEAYKQTNGVLVRWVIIGGGQCQGTNIYRSQDQLNFEQIGHIDGICGSSDGDETYSFFDTIPQPNAYNHYRLEMGFQGFSSIVTVFYEDFGKLDYALLSQPQQSLYKILFSNDPKNEAELRVYDITGKAMYSATSNNSDIEIQTDGWNQGTYIFRITGVSESDITGKFYIGAP